MVIFHGLVSIRFEREKTTDYEKSRDTKRFESKQRKRIEIFLWMHLDLLEFLSKSLYFHLFVSGSLFSFICCGVLFIPCAPTMIKAFNVQLTNKNGLFYIIAQSKPSSRNRIERKTFCLHWRTTLQIQRAWFITLTRSMWSSFWAYFLCSTAVQAHLLIDLRICFWKVINSLRRILCN